MTTEKSRRSSTLSCSAYYVTPWTIVFGLTAFYILIIICIFKRGKKICQPIPDSLFLYQKKLNYLKRDLSHLLVDESNIEINNHKLGQGSVGFVFKGSVFPKTQKRYKQKVPAAVKLSYPIPQKSIGLLEEAAKMAKLEHPHIVGILAVSKLSFTIFRPMIVMEWLAGGSLSEYFREEIRERDEGDRPVILLREILEILVQVANALRHIHESTDQFGQEYTHGDVAARNVLLTSRDLRRCTAKLGDFGLPANFGPLPIPWLPPEIVCAMEKNPRHRSESDVWMFGVLSWECLTLGAEPHYQRTLSDIQRCFRLPDRGLTCPHSCPLDVWSLVMECLSEAHRRPCFTGSVDTSPSILVKLYHLRQVYTNSMERLYPLPNISNCTCSEHRCKLQQQSYGLEK